MVGNAGSDLSCASEELRGDREVVLAAIENNGDALRFADDKFRSDVEIVRKAMTSAFTALHGASRDILNNKEVLLDLLTINGYALMCIPKALRNDYDIVMTAVKQPKCGVVLKFASEELQGNREIALAAVKSCAEAFDYIPSSVTEDPSFMLGRSGGRECKCLRRSIDQPPKRPRVNVASSYEEWNVPRVCEWRAEWRCGNCDESGKKQWRSFSVRRRGAQR